MVFKYSAINQQGEQQEGTIDAVSIDVAILSLQRKGLVISAINPADQPSSVFAKKISLFQRISNKDMVVLSRQLATLFESQVSALRVFRLIAEGNEHPLIRSTLHEIADDLQGGSTISASLAKHPKIFTPFYVSMVKAGEESGKLDQVFVYLADHLDRTYEVTAKARNALIYPVFVIVVFIAVMLLMFTMVIPKISAILLESGQDIPIYTKIVLAISNILVNWYWVILVGIPIAGYIFWRYIRTDDGELQFERMKLSLPYIGSLYKKLYLSRIADNLNTMLSSGITMIRALEITADVVGGRIYRDILLNAVEMVKGGASVSETLSRYEEIPSIMIQMIRVGEETGQLGNILKTLAKFYRREVINAVDTLIDLIEPVMIVLLGLGVGTLLASVLVPIYNIAQGF
jgi:type IV pilus assembly protein PilC